MHDCGLRPEASIGSPPVITNLHVHEVHGYHTRATGACSQSTVHALHLAALQHPTRSENGTQLTKRKDPASRRTIPHKWCVHPGPSSQAPRRKLDKHKRAWFRWKRERLIDVTIKSRGLVVLRARRRVMWLIIACFQIDVVHRHYFA